MARNVEGVGMLRLQPKIWRSDRNGALLAIGWRSKSGGSIVEMKLVPEAGTRVEQILSAADELHCMPSIVASRENPRSRKGEWELRFLFSQRPQELDVDVCLERAAELLGDALKQLD